MDKDKVIGIVLLVLGILFVVGFIDIPYLDELVAVAALVAGVLVLIHKLRGPQWLGITLIVVGALMLVTPWLSFLAGTIAALLNLAIGVVLIVLGVLRLK